MRRMDGDSVRLMAGLLIALSKLNRFTDSIRLVPGHSKTPVEAVRRFEVLVREESKWRLYDSNRALRESFALLNGMVELGEREFSITVKYSYERGGRVVTAKYDRYSLLLRPGEEEVVLEMRRISGVMRTAPEDICEMLAEIVSSQEGGISVVLREISCGETP